MINMVLIPLDDAIICIVDASIEGVVYYTACWCTMAGMTLSTPGLQGVLCAGDSKAGVGRRVCVVWLLALVDLGIRG